MATTQTAVRVVRQGDTFAEIAEVHQVEIPQPGPGEVLVRMKYMPINPSDIGRIKGRHGQPYPRGAGLEGTGTIEKLGEGVTKFKTGQRVVALGWQTGTYQQYALAKQEALSAVPEGVDDKVAAQFLVNPVTVVGLLHELAVPKGEWLLQTAAGSVLGRQLIVLAKRAGIKTINVVRRSAQKEELLQLGADEVIATDQEDMVKRCAEITGGKGVYGAVESVGGTTTAEVVKALRPGGTALLFGSFSGSTATVTSLDIIYSAKKLNGFILFGWLNQMGDDEKQQVLKEVWDLLQAGVIKPLTGRVYPLEKAVEALEESVREARGGKVLLEG